MPTKLHQGRHRPIEFEDLQLPGTQRVDSLTSERFTPLVPDAVFELQDPDTGAELDVLIEYDRTGRPAKNAEKLLRADALLCGWWFHIARWRDMKQRPVVLFVCQTDQHLHALMRAAYKLLTGRIARPANPVAQWPYPGRRYTRFAVAPDLHAGSHRAWRLPDRPTEHTGQPLELCETQLSGTR